jgi:hypothetical protein
LTHLLGYTETTGYDLRKYITIAESEDRLAHLIGITALIDHTADPNLRGLRFHFDEGTVVLKNPCRNLGDKIKRMIDRPGGERIVAVEVA